MNAWLSWRPDERLAQVMRAVLRRGTRMSHHLFSIVGGFAVLLALALWLMPAWRGTLAAKLMPVISAAVQAGPARLLQGNPLPSFAPAMRRRLTMRCPRTIRQRRQHRRQHRRRQQHQLRRRLRRQWHERPRRRGSQRARSAHRADASARWRADSVATRRCRRPRRPRAGLDPRAGSGGELPGAALSRGSGTGQRTREGGVRHRPRSRSRSAAAALRDGDRIGLQSVCRKRRGRARA